MQAMVKIRMAIPFDFFLICSMLRGGIRKASTSFRFFRAYMLIATREQKKAKTIRIKRIVKSLSSSMVQLILMQM